MYWFIMIAFVIGVGVGISLPRAGRKGGEFDPKSLPSENPFLDEVDSTEADELREVGAVAVQDRIAKRKERILAKAKAEGRITNDGVEDLFCISDRTAGNYLGQMVDENVLIKVGNTGRGVYYEPV
ncbi:hypothetical protein KC845_02575 [Candidatus Kaiserbacteria bacterium]|nr:hypothetical protein [Candidatus Kaiserbacteria bacterium]